MLLDSLILIAGMFALGVFSRRVGLLPEQASEVLNRFVLQICLPALVYLTVRKLQWQPSLLVLVLVAWGLGALGWLLAVLLARRLGWSRRVEGCLILTLMLGNTAFLGYPMVQGLLGAAAMPAAVVYDQLGTFVLLTVGGLSVAATYSGAPRPGPRQTVLTVITYPAFVALVLALLPLAPPAWLEQFLSRIAGLLVPIALYAVGLSFHLTPLRDERAPLLAGLAIKMLLSPLLAYALLRLSAAPEAVLGAGVLQAAMPAMVTAGALAIQHQLAPRLAAGLVGYGVLIALAWLPLLAWLLRLQGSS